MASRKDTKPVPRLPGGEGEKPSPKGKGGTSRISIGELENVAGFATVQMEAFAKAWEATLGRAVSVSAPEAARLAVAELAEALAGRRVLVRMAFSGRRKGDCWLFLAEADAAVMAGLVSMLSEEEIASKSRSPLADEDFSALAEVFAHAATQAAADVASEFREECSIAAQDVFPLESPGGPDLARMVGLEPLTVAFWLQMSGFQSTRAILAYAGEIADSFAPKKLKSTDTQIVPVLGAAQAGARSLAKELGMSPGGAPAAQAKPAEPAGEVDLERVMRVPLSVSVRVAERKMFVGEVLELSPGTVMQLGVKAHAPLGIYVNNHRVAEGDVVVKGERFAIQVSSVESARDLVRAMR